MSSSPSHIAVAALGAAAQASSPTTVPGLVYTAGYGNSMVARYDPLGARAHRAARPARRERQQLELVAGAALSRDRELPAQRLTIIEVVRCA